MLLSFVKRRQGAYREPESIVQNINEEMIDLEGLPNKRPHNGVHSGAHGGWVGAVHGDRPCERVVLGDVDELDGVASARSVGSVRASCLVAEIKSASASRRDMQSNAPKGVPIISLLELHLLFQW